MHLSLQAARDLPQHRLAQAIEDLEIEVSTLPIADRLQPLLAGVSSVAALSEVIKLIGK